MFTMRHSSIILLATAFYFSTIDPSISGKTDEEKNASSGGFRFPWQNKEGQNSNNSAQGGAKFNMVRFPNPWQKQDDQNAHDPVTDDNGNDKKGKAGGFNIGTLWPQKPDKGDGSDSDDNGQSNPYYTGNTQNKGNNFGGLQLGTFGWAQKPKKDNYDSDSSSDDDDSDGAARRRDDRYNTEAAIRASMDG